MMLWSGEDMAVLNFPLDEGGGIPLLASHRHLPGHHSSLFFSQSRELLAPKDQPYKFNKLI